MLVVGMHGRGNVADGGMGETEYKVHFMLWCMLASPLMIGCDVRAMSEATRGILLNEGLIAVNQDPLGVQARSIGGGQLDWHGWDYQVWSKPLADGAGRGGPLQPHRRQAARDARAVGGARDPRPASPVA